MFLVTFDFEHTYIKKWCYASGVYKLVYLLINYQSNVF